MNNVNFMNNNVDNNSIQQQPPPHEEVDSNPPLGNFQGKAIKKNSQNPTTLEQQTGKIFEEALQDSSSIPDALEDLEITVQKEETSVEEEDSVEDLGQKTKKIGQSVLNEMDDEGNAVGDVPQTNVPKTIKANYKDLEKQDGELSTPQALRNMIDGLIAKGVNPKHIKLTGKLAKDAEGNPIFKAIPHPQDNNDQIYTVKCEYVITAQDEHGNPIKDHQGNPVKLVFHETIASLVKASEPDSRIRALISMKNYKGMIQAAVTEHLPQAAGRIQVEGKTGRIFNKVKKGGIFLFKTEKDRSGKYVNNRKMSLGGKETKLEPKKRYYEVLAGSNVPRKLYSENISPIKIGRAFYSENEWLNKVKIKVAGQEDEAIKKYNKDKNVENLIKDFQSDVKKNQEKFHSLAQALDESALDSLSNLKQEINQNSITQPELKAYIEKRDLYRQALSKLRIAEEELDHLELNKQSEGLEKVAQLRGEFQKSEMDFNTVKDKFRRDFKPVAQSLINQFESLKEIQRYQKEQKKELSKLARKEFEQPLKELQTKDQSTLTNEEKEQLKTLQDNLDQLNQIKEDLQQAIISNDKKLQTFKQKFVDAIDILTTESVEVDKDDLGLQNLFDPSQQTVGEPIVELEEEDFS
jgi:hypothetical protein